MIKAIIVDDEELNREFLSNLIHTYCPEIKVAGMASSVNDAILAISQMTPDIVFLDVEILDDSGFSVLEAFPEPDFETIFITAHADYAIKAIRMNASDYLLKPIKVAELKAAIARASKRIGRKTSGLTRDRQFEIMNNPRQGHILPAGKIAISTKDGITFANLDEILYCQADRSYCEFIFTSGKKMMASKPMKEYEDVLEGAGFFRAHKSYMVNLNHVSRYIKKEGGYIEMDNGDQIEVATRKKKSLWDLLEKSQ
ncbi:MAG: response regulator transcription factor [Flavobacteriales bacterium]|nr:response regulator transcription factor [Flavobacteriales bacterium]MCB9447962.1 response regulator transcription factor [Flavobacteriales bacterium]